MLPAPLAAKDVAAFLHLHQDRLDKTAIGEFLGKEKEYMGGLGFKVTPLEAQHGKVMAHGGSHYYFLKTFTWFLSHVEFRCCTSILT